MQTREEVENREEGIENCDEGGYRGIRRSGDQGTKIVSNLSLISRCPDSLVPDSRIT